MAEDSIFDTVIVGGGLAGLTAALYLARARCRVLVVEKDEFGGQINITDSVVNYPGVFSASGRELTDTMRRQAEAFGAEFLLAEVSSLELDGDVKRVVTSRGSFEALDGPARHGRPPAHGRLCRRGAVPRTRRGVLRHLRRGVLLRA